jgi:hypothetical protein
MVNDIEPTDEPLDPEDDEQTLDPADEPEEDDQDDIEPDEVVVSLIDEVLALIDRGTVRYTAATESELRSYRTEAQFGTLHPGDRKYVLVLCKRLLAPERVEDRTRRIERYHRAAQLRKRMIARHRRAGQILDTVPDLQWLYFDLALREPAEVQSQLGPCHIEHQLEEFVSGEPLYMLDNSVDGSIKLKRFPII